MGVGQWVLHTPQKQNCKRLQTGLFWVLAVMPPGCFLSGLRRRGLRLLKLSFTVLFRSLPLLSLFSSPFSILSTSGSTSHLWPSLRSVCWPCLICWAVVAACGLLSVVLLGVGRWLWPSSCWFWCRRSHSRPLCSMCKLYNLSLAHLVTFKASGGIILAFSY